VTGVRWEKVKPFKSSDLNIDEILVTCSDDETLRIYHPHTWTLLHTLKTSIIQEWHTITYTAIQPSGNQVACVTQNGFVFILCLDNFECHTIERIHNGSIEGLDWKQKLVTCSSEGLCCVITI
jgi:WD40 repeat protein